LIEKLNSYLNGALSYYEACSIFGIVSKNKRISQNLMRDDSKKNREKLEYEIKKILKNSPQAVRIDTEVLKYISEPLIQEKPTIKQETKSISFSLIAENKSSGIKNSILERRKELYRERGHFHGRMHEAETNEARYELAKSIMDIQPKIDSLNRDLKEIENGQLPSKYLKTEATAGEFRTVRNVKMYIARAKKKLLTETNPSEIEKLKSLLESYNQKLKNL
jgi:hypothetical protein